MKEQEPPRDALRELDGMRQALELLRFDMNRLIDMVERNRAELGRLEYRDALRNVPPESKEDILNRLRFMDLKVQALDEKVDRLREYTEANTNPYGR